jgi:signal transduction histidine kinase
MKQNSKTLADASVAYALRGDVANLKYLIWPYTKNSRISMIEIIVGKRSTIAMYRNNSNIIIAREIPSVFRDKELKVESSDLAYNHRKIGVVNIYYQGKAIENALEDEKSRLINKLGLFTQDIKSDASQIFMRHFLIMFIALFVVFSISSLLVAVYYKKHKDQNKLTFEKNIELTIALDNLTKAKNQLVESEKLASLGSLVSGISHEINNPVGVALTAITSLKSRSAKITKKLDNGELTDLDVNEFLDYVVEAVEITHRNLKVTSELVKSFKDISADQQSGEKREIVLKQYIEEIFRSISPEFKQKRHSYDIICDANLKITTYPGVWFQVFANLAGNSVKHGFKDLESGNIIVEVIKRTENTIQIIYQDNGHGINEGVLRKVFDPFFTTNRSQGSGLGLSIVYSLVTQKLKGVITASNATHGGAKFVITVPVKI